MLLSDTKWPIEITYLDPVGSELLDPQGRHIVVNTAMPITIYATVKIATNNEVGVVKPGNHLLVTDDGALNVITGTQPRQIPELDVSGQLPQETIPVDIRIHVLNKNNPHEVTAEQVGLGNVDNTSDIDKPISTAQQAAFDAAQTRDTALSEQITAEVAAREAAVEAEATLRDTAVSHVQDNLDEETSERLADVARIDGEMTDAKGRITSLETLRDGGSKTHIQIVANDIDNGTPGKMIWQDISLTSVAGNNLAFQLKIGTRIVGTISIPEQQLFDSITYDDTTHTLVFTYTTIDGTTQHTDVDLSDLEEVYNAGDGLEAIVSTTGVTFKVKVNSDSSDVLSVDSSGIHFTGKLGTRIAFAKNVQGNLGEGAAVPTAISEYTPSTVNGVPSDLTIGSIIAIKYDRVKVTALDTEDVGDVQGYYQVDTLTVDATTGSVKYNLSLQQYIETKKGDKGEKGTTGATGDIGPSGTSIFFTNSEYTSSTTKIPTSDINISRADGTLMAGDVLLTPGYNLFKVLAPASVLSPNEASVSYKGNMHGTNGIDGQDGKDGAKGDTPLTAVHATLDFPIDQTVMFSKVQLSREPSEGDVMWLYYVDDDGNVAGVKSWQYVTPVTGTTDAWFFKVIDSITLPEKIIIGPRKIADDDNLDDYNKITDVGEYYGTWYKDGAFTNLFDSIPQDCDTAMAEFGDLSNDIYSFYLKITVDIDNSIIRQDFKAFFPASGFLDESFIPRVERGDCFATWTRFYAISEGAWTEWAKLDDQVQGVRGAAMTAGTYKTGLVSLSPADILGSASVGNVSTPIYYNGAKFVAGNKVSLQSIVGSSAIGSTTRSIYYNGSGLAVGNIYKVYLHVVAVIVTMGTNDLINLKLYIPSRDNTRLTNSTIGEVVRNISDNSIYPVVGYRQAANTVTDQVLSIDSTKNTFTLRLASNTTTTSKAWSSAIVNDTVKDII